MIVYLFSENGVITQYSSTSVNIDESIIQQYMIETIEPRAYLGLDVQTILTKNDAEIQQLWLESRRIIHKKIEQKEKLESLKQNILSLNRDIEFNEVMNYDTDKLHKDLKDKKEQYELLLKQ